MDVFDHQPLNNSDHKITTSNTFLLESLIEIIESRYAILLL